MPIVRASESGKLFKLSIAERNEDKLFHFFNCNARIKVEMKTNSCVPIQGSKSNPSASANRMVRIVCGTIREYCADTPFHNANTPSDFTVLLSTSNTPEYS
jgi:hypothetical protein